MKPTTKNKPPEALSALFTKREKMVVILACQQFSNKEIAGMMHRSVRTIECHKKNMMQKTGSRNMVGIVMYAVKSKIFLPALLGFVSFMEWLASIADNSFYILLQQ
ncbi:MAG TPA: LuxR C-terminal-related transcriptional regulator [Chitinophagaceae bacterium]